VSPDNYRDLNVGVLDWKVSLAADGWVQTGVQVRELRPKNNPVSQELA